MLLPYFITLWAIFVLASGDAYKAYHGLTAAQHQTNFESLSTTGYRMISLSVYGNPSDTRYAAVWIQRPGPAWVAVHNINSAAYQTYFDTWTSRGYIPTLISATGSINDVILAAVFEKVSDSSWKARLGLTSGSETTAGTFQYENKQAHDRNMIIKSFTIYGTASDRRYGAVWRSNPGYVKWHVHYADSGSSYQTTLDAEIQLPWYRPAYVTLSDDHAYCSVFKDEMVGSWYAKHGLTSDQYQAELDMQSAKGFHPINVQGGGTGTNTLYAAIFAQTDVPLVRQWAATGVAVQAFSAFDSAMKSFMQDNAVRTGQLTIAKNGATKLARAYTWAEPGYRITQPSDVFLLASCSKIFLEAAVQSLYDTHKIKPSTAVYPLLGFSSPKDPRSDTITIQQLLDHYGGYDKDQSNFDPTYNMRDIALAQNLPAHRAVTKKDIVAYMYARPLDYTPGTKYVYSNYGYLLASTVVEKLTGSDYFSYLQTALLQPAGISEVNLWPTVALPRPTNEVIQEDQGLGLSPLDPASQLLIPSIYGGDGEIKEVGAACAGTAASTTAMTKFIHLHKVWGNGPRPAKGGDWPTPCFCLTRTGSTPGASTLASSRSDGIDWAYTINTRDFPPGTSNTLGTLEHRITQLLDTTAIV